MLQLKDGLSRLRLAKGVIRTSGAHLAVNDINELTQFFVKIWFNDLTKIFRNVVGFVTSFFCP